MEATPTYDQDKFAGRCDIDGEVSGGSDWKQSDGSCGSLTANVDWTQVVDANFRVRFVIQETAGVAQPNFLEGLQYNRNSLGWNDVDDSASLVVRMSLSSQFAHADDTTQQLGSGTFLTANDGMNETNPPGSNMRPDYGGNDETEFEFCAQIRGVDVNDADTIELRVVKAGNALNTYTNTPTLTVSKAGAALPFQRVIIF